MLNSWNDIKSFFAEEDQIIISKLEELNVSIPEYLETVIKKSDEGNDILMAF